MKSLKQLILESIEMENAISFKECSLDDVFQTIISYPKNKRIWFTEDKLEEEDKKWFLKSAKEDNAVFYEIYVKNVSIGFIGLSSLLNMINERKTTVTDFILSGITDVVEDWSITKKYAALCQPYIYMLCVNNEAYKKIKGDFNVLDCMFSIYSKLKKELIYTYTTDHTLEKYKLYLLENSKYISSETKKCINKFTAKDIIKFITAIPKNERLYKIYTSNKIGFKLLSDQKIDGQQIHILIHYLYNVNENNYFEFLTKK